MGYHQSITIFDNKFQPIDYFDKKTAEIVFENGNLIMINYTFMLSKGFFQCSITPEELILIIEDKISKSVKKYI